ncbi:phosphate uptake regulator [Dysgonomonadaceae bacterium PH5-43]|nr:phosphate uptake regulator [Dysgonomonadaceae bacterium PH5-43]
MYSIKKKSHFEELYHDFEQLSVALLKQLKLAQYVLENGWNQQTEEETEDNDIMINDLEVKITDIFPILITLYAPKAKELRNIISCHEATMFIEFIANISKSIIYDIKPLDFNTEELEELRNIISNIFTRLKEKVNAATYSYHKNDKEQAINILNSKNEVKELVLELKENIIASFQDIALSAQDLLTIITLNKIAQSLEKIDIHTLNIAKATIFAIDGINMRYKNIQSKVL